MRSNIRNEYGWLDENDGHHTMGTSFLMEVSPDYTVEGTSEFLLERRIP